MPLTVLLTAFCFLPVRLNLNGKALFFKTITVRQHQMLSDFRPEPDGTSAQQAFEFLRQDPAFR